MKIVLLIRSVVCFAMLAAITSVVMLGATCDVNAATIYTWNPTALTAAAGNWDNTTSTGWNTAGGYPGSAGDLTVGAVENDVADMNSKAYTRSSVANGTIHMNGVNAFLSELDIGSTSTSSSAAGWTLDGLGATAGGSLTFKALSGTAVLSSTMARNGKPQTISVPVTFASNTNVTITPSVGLTDYIEIPGTVSGAGNLTINTPGTSGGGVFALEGDVSGYTGTIKFDSTGTVTAGNDRVGLISSLVAGPSAANAHQMSLILSGSSSLGKVGISDIELGALNGTGGNIHPYIDGIGPQTLKVGYKNNTSDSYSGVLSGSVAGQFMSFEKAGTGIQILDGVNTYAGTTTVSSGTLLVNGTNSGGGAYSVASGAILGGTGGIGASVVTVGAGGFLAPGTSIESLDVGGASISGTLSVEYQGVVGTGNDLIDLLNVAGGLDITNATLDLASLGGTPDDGALIFAKYGSLTGTQFASVTGSLPANYTINYAYNDGASSNNIALVQVPEPCSLGLAAMMLLGLCFGRSASRHEVR
jgi:fibronectin-binding autotransporter adhesin